MCCATFSDLRGARRFTACQRACYGLRMRAVVQRVSRAEVRETPEVAGTPSPEPDKPQVAVVSLGRIERGLCVLLGIGQGDDSRDVAWLADKVAGLRIFPDPPAANDAAALKDATPPPPKSMNRSLRDVGGAILVISQFTLYADASKGRRPSFTGALHPSQAEPLYEEFVRTLRAAGYPVQTGRFGAMMAVELVNDGPVTLLLDSREGRAEGER
jgi:D-tyrosyl-tRNA(Tyr) deacylase